MDKDVLIFSIMLGLPALIIVIVFVLGITSYIELDAYCQSQGMEMSGWSPTFDSVSCRVLEDGYVVRRSFRKYEGVWYPEREE